MPHDKLDASLIIKDARRELAQPQRRLFAKQLLTLGGLSLLTGCTLTDEPSVNAMLRRISAFNDRVQAGLFDPAQLAPTYPDSMITQPFPFNAYYDIDQVPEVDAATYRLQLSGLVKGKREWRLEELRALPQANQVTRLICVEGWSAIGKWGGVTFADFLRRADADTTAR
jgi:DMSO/TMAO reductase YedYZ molybdopterin-dependent catalytic subunit